MNLRKLLSYSVLIGATTLILGACGSTSQKTNSDTTATSNNGGKVVFVPKVTGNSFFESGNLGAQEMAN